MPNSARFMLPVLVLLIVLGLAAPASGAAPEWQAVDVILHADQQPMLLVSGELPADTPLPVEAELAVPSGTQLQWIGEILGGDPAADPALQYTKVTLGDMDVYRFTLTKSRIAQVEVLAPGMAGLAGTEHSSALKWTAWRDLAQVRIAQRLPQGVTLIQPASGAAMEPGAPGYSYYAKTLTGVAQGQQIDLTFAYTVSSSATGSGPAGDAGNRTLWWFLGLAFAGILAVVLVVVMRSSRLASAGHAEGEDNDAFFASDDAEPEDEPVRSAQASGADDATSTAKPATTRPIKPATIILGITGAALVGVILAVSAGTAPKSTGGIITKSFGAASPCTSASIPVAAAPGVDLAAEGARLVDVFVGSEGIGDVRLDAGRGVIDIAFCDSVQTEQTLRDMLEGSGLVTTGEAPAESASGTETTVPANGE